MSLKRFLVLSILSFLALSMFSCNEVEEETNVTFEWDYVRWELQIKNDDTSWVIASSEKYKVDEYSIVKDSNMMQIYGHTTSDDSIVMSFLNNSGSAENVQNKVTVGNYEITGNYLYNILFIKDNQPTFSVDGFANISYINSRVDIDFYSPLNNGYNLENGVAENLDVYLVPADTIE